MNRKEQLEETERQLDKIVRQYQEPDSFRSNYTIAEWIERIGKELKDAQLRIDTLTLQLELLTNLTKKQ